MHRSTGRWKVQVWTEVLAAVNRAQPNDPKTTVKIQTHINYYSGVGWDDEAKHCTATAEYQAEFLQDTRIASQRPAPFTTNHDMLEKIYEGGKNYATGSQVLHLGYTVKRVAVAQVKREKENHAVNINMDDDDAADEAPQKKAAKSKSKLKTKEAAAPLGRIPSSDGEKESTADAMGMHLEPMESPPKPSQCESSCKCIHADSDGNDADTSHELRHCRSKSSSSSSAKGKVDAMNNFACSVNNLATAFTQPVVVRDDLSYIAQVNKILQEDLTILPAGDDGSYYSCISCHFSKDPQDTLNFTTSPSAQHRRLIHKILREKGRDTMCGICETKWPDNSKHKMARQLKTMARNGCAAGDQRRLRTSTSAQPDKVGFKQKSMILLASSKKKTRRKRGCFAELYHTKLDLNLCLCDWEDWHDQMFLEVPLEWHDLTLMEFFIKRIAKVPGIICPLAYVPDVLDACVTFEATGKYYYLNTAADYLEHFGGGFYSHDDFLAAFTQDPPIKGTVHHFPCDMEELYAAVWEEQKRLESSLPIET
ncbi:hypothetical protein GGX14DRAFT_404866 [Mycena pura]|uniref:Uncharacterized protein n=1 Tax=Mycena pura TaxID=153505 RepID=A0AAD6UXN2_9AGAR|nr:hypothetical protein GGX14DRAFT_404866 [Mycena pura]